MNELADLLAGFIAGLCFGLVLRDEIIPWLVDHLIHRFRRAVNDRAG